MNIHGLKKKIKEANQDYKKSKITTREWIKRKARYNFKIKKLREEKKSKKKK